MAIKHEFKIGAKPEVVFKAISTKKGYQGWWAIVCEINCAINRSSVIKFEKENLTEEMCFKTIEVIKNEKLVWYCTSNNVFKTWVNTTLTFEIDKIAGESFLKFTQNSPDKNWKNHDDYAGSLAGWKFFMGSLKNYCETGIGEPWG